MDYEKLLKIPFVTYVLANIKPKPTNTNAPRFFSEFICELQIALKEVTSSYTCRLTPSLCVIVLHLLRSHLQLSSGINIPNIKVLILYGSAWIAGVDYSEHNDDENEFENESGYEKDNDTESSDVLTEDEDLIENVDPNEVGDILEDPSYNAI